MSKLWEIRKDRYAWHAAVLGVAKSWTGLSNGRTTMYPDHKKDQLNWNQKSSQELFCFALM